MYRREIATALLLLAVFGATLAVALEEDVETTRVPVHFVSNRNLEESEEGRVALGGGRDVSRWGRCEVEFQPIPMVSEIAPKIPFYVQTETNEQRIELDSNPESFWRSLVEAAEKTATRSVILFVHGYSYDIERGCHRAAEIQRALEGEAVVLLFSWPSNGKATDYMPDVADLEWSVPALAHLLEQLALHFEPDRVHVLSHSLGARGMVLALDHLRAEQLTGPLFGRWVLLAPDLDTQTFVDALPRLQPAAESITLYASSNDTPLKVSHQLSGSPRLGEAGEYLTVIEGMETIDVSQAGRYQILGHEYFFFHPSVAEDLLTLLRQDLRAAARPGLRSRTRNGLTYWEVVGQERP